MHKKPAYSTAHGRVLKKPPRYCTTESSSEERAAEPELPTELMSMKERIARMADQTSRTHSQHLDSGSDHDDDDEIIPNSQRPSDKSLTFSDVMRIAKQPKTSVREINEAPSSPELPVNGHPASATGTSGLRHRPVTSNISIPQTCSCTVRLNERLEIFETNQEQRLAELIVTIRQEHRNDMVALEAYIQKRSERSEMRIRKILTEEREQASVYPYEKPPGFPLDSLEAFEQFEGDTDRQQALKKYLVQVGGTTARDALIQFVKESMTDRLTKKFSWTGMSFTDKEDLKSLYDTCMGKVFFDALRACQNIPNPQDRTEFARLMQDAIRTAKQRLRDAKRRAEKVPAGRNRRGRYEAEMAERYEVEHSDCEDDH